MTRNKRGQGFKWGEIIGLLIAVLVIVAFLIYYLISSGRATGFIEKILNFFKFRS